MPTSAWFWTSSSRAWAADKREKSSRAFWFTDRVARLSMGSKLSTLLRFDSTMSSLSSKFPFGHIEEEVEGKMPKGRESPAWSFLFWDGTLWTEAVGYLSFFSSALFLCIVCRGFLQCGSRSSSDPSVTKAFTISTGVHLVEDMFPLTTAKERLSFQHRSYLLDIEN